MKNYYLDGEEKFGPVSSFFYSLCAKFSPLSRFYSFVMNDLGSEKFNMLLDVGTGPGRIPIMLASGRYAKHIYAIDPSVDMIRIAKSNSGNLGILFAEGSSRHVPFKKKFDVIISTMSFHHWEDKKGSLKYLAKFLNNRGEIRIYEHEKEKLGGIRKFFGSAHSVSNKEMAKVAKGTGLKIKNVLEKDSFIRVTFVR